MNKQTLREANPGLAFVSDLLFYLSVIIVLSAVAYAIFCLSDYNSFLSEYTIIPVLISAAFSAIACYAWSEIIWLLLEIKHNTKKTHDNVSAYLMKTCEVYAGKKKLQGITEVNYEINNDTYVKGFHEQKEGRVKSGKSINDMYKK